MTGNRDRQGDGSETAWGDLDTECMVCSSALDVSDWCNNSLDLV
jgi:hypothetical protein